MVNIETVTFSYPKARTPALAGIRAEIPEGIRLLVGENGAGKTTLLHVVAGLLCPQHGRVTVDGAPTLSDRPSHMGRVFLLEENADFPAPTIRKFAEIHSPFYPEFSQETFEANLAAFGLTGNEKQRNLSLGNRKKAQLAYALALGVPVLLLDEPTNGLDIQSRETLRHILASQTADGQTVVISTHSVSEFRHLYDGILAISHGHILLAASNDEISERLAFRSMPIPPPDTLYSELRLGSYVCLTPANGECTMVDWELLYKSISSQLGMEIINLFNAD